MLTLILCAILLAPPCIQALDLPAYRGDLEEFDNLLHLPSGEGPNRMILGDNNGRIQAS